MIEPPRIADTKAEIAAVIRLTIPWNRMEAEMPRAIREVMAAVSAQGLRTVGPLFDRHLKPPAEVFDFQVGFPVSAPVAPAGRVRPGEIPAGRVVRTVYHGGYEGLAGAWEEFRTRLRKERLKPGKTFWQRYLLGPESNPDPSAWRTELNVPPVEDAP